MVGVPAGTACRNPEFDKRVRETEEHKYSAPFSCLAWVVLFSLFLLLIWWCFFRLSLPAFSLDVKFDVCSSEKVVCTVLCCVFYEMSWIYEAMQLR